MKLTRVLNIPGFDVSLEPCFCLGLHDNDIVSITLDRFKDDPHPTIFQTKLSYILVNRDGEFIKLEEILKNENA